MGLRAALLFLLLPAGLARAEEDAYAKRLRLDEAFRRIDPIEPASWDTWIYMPWRYQWEIGTGDAGGAFCREFGINGGMTDHGAGPFEWLHRFGLRFYNDHTAGKGFLHLREPVEHGPVRPIPVDERLFATLRDLMRPRVERLRTQSGLVAYALDDEISTGILLRPNFWRLVEGAPEPPPHPPSLDGTLSEIDLQRWIGPMQQNDSAWASFLGRLVEECNRLDPLTPCGFVGAQAPSLFGGYDYAKLMRKVQFLEAYDVGSAPAIARSFAPEVPLVLTHFVGEDSWKAWYHFAHGQRGMIGWVEGWFEEGKPRPWLLDFRATLHELGGVQGPKMRGARFLHDGVAIYYSHPSIQVSWFLDAEAHGATWRNRQDDALLGTSHLVRKAWEFLLQDAGLQYDFLSYETVVREGVPAEYRALVLPACFAISDAEAARLAEFVHRGGILVADFMCGLFDETGRGRTFGALDALFGVEHRGGERRGDFFSGKLWVEADQEKGYRSASFGALLDTAPCPTREGFAIPERRLPAEGSRKGGAVYLNLSPQRYLQFREEGRAEARHRRLFCEPLGIEPRVVPLTGGERTRNVEVTCFRKGERILLFVVSNPPLQRDGSRRPPRSPVRVELRFREPVDDLVNERTGERLPVAEAVALTFDPQTAIFLSFRAPP